MFHKRTTANPSEFIVFVTHVDDFAIASSTPQLRQELFECLRLKYTIEDNNLEHFLGINIEHRTIDGVKYLCQSQPMHLQRLFKLCNIDEATDTDKSPPTPMATRQPTKNLHHATETSTDGLSGASSTSSRQDQM
jgi:hypothetical protein